MQFETSAFGMRFWGAAAFLLLSSVACIGIAARAQSAAGDTTGIISVTDALRQLEHKPTIRVGVMTERLRRGEVTERIRPEVELIATEGSEP